MIKKQLLILILLVSTKLAFSQFTIQQNFSNAGCNTIFYVYDVNGNVLCAGGPTPPNPSPSTCITGMPDHVDISWTGSTGFQRFWVNVRTIAPSSFTCGGILRTFWVDVSYVTGGSTLPGCNDILYLTF